MGKVLGDRLRLLREQTHLSQTAFAALGGVQKGAQINYEKGEREPDSDYLVRLAAAGVDVQFALTGIPLMDPSLRGLWQRAAEVTLESDGDRELMDKLLDGYRRSALELDAEERQLIALWRVLGPPARSALMSTANALPRQADPDFLLFDASTGVSTAVEVKAKAPVEAAQSFSNNTIGQVVSGAGNTGPNLVVMPPASPRRRTSR